MIFLAFEGLQPKALEGRWAVRVYSISRSDPVSLAQFLLPIPK